MENNVRHQICNFYDHGKWNGGFSGYVSCVSPYKFGINIEEKRNSQYAMVEETAYLFA